MVLTPRSAKKREQILQAAGQLFIEVGYAVSMDQIAIAAKVSKQTVYAHFKTKDELFETCVKTRCESNRLHGHLKDDPRSAEEALLDFALNFQDMMLSSQVMNTYRTAVSQVDSHPALGKAYLKAGPEPTTLMVQEYFESLQQKKVLNKTYNVENLAFQFMLMIHGKAVYWSTLGVDIEQTKIEQKAYLRSVVRLILSIDN
ncbi:TetR/AcrR family transcriptional regulator [Vibrio sp. FNV 38]|nr:TetR/AcrR family transcriptional regulator [Vibrio sp. FNV 38]